VKLIGRWTKVDFRGGYDLLGTDNPEALAEMAVQWNDIWISRSRRCWRIRTRHGRGGQEGD